MKYRQFVIEPEGKNFEVIHEDYDGPEDDRYFHAETVEEAKLLVDTYYADEEAKPQPTKFERIITRADDPEYSYVVKYDRVKGQGRSRIIDIVACWPADGSAEYDAHERNKLLPNDADFTFSGSGWYSVPREYRIIFHATR